MPEEFKIPEMTYKIPLKEFFVWYDTLLAKQWNAMSAEGRNEYFEKADLEELKNTALSNLGEHCFQDAHILAGEILTSPKYTNLFTGQ